MKYRFIDKTKEATSFILGNRRYDRFICYSNCFAGVLPID